MCGIGGFITLSSSFDLDQISKYFINGLIHRGPDSQGVWFSGEDKLVLAHTRLSILDLSMSANQPMKSLDGNIIITFNGEIYNYGEIKKELSGRNKYQWITDHSDTEVIIHAYEEWGINCLNKFRGIFAFGLWDNREKTLYVVRDRFGVKPVYFISKPDHFGFSSELKPFFNIYKRKKLNSNAVIEYLTTRGSLAPNTMVEDMFKLDKGHYLKIQVDQGKSKISKTLIRYYDINNKIPSSSFNYSSHDEILDNLEQQLVTSIRYRWISDTPVCLFLSGGIDSSLIASISSKLFKEKIHAFTIGLRGSIHDETKYARKVAEQYKLNIHVLDFLNNPLEDLENWLYFNDDLLSDPAAFALFFLSKEIRSKGFKVVLSGEGSDEIFAGYDSYNKYYREIQKPPINNLLAYLLKNLYSVSPFRSIEKYFPYNSENNIYSGAADLQNVLSREFIVDDKDVLDHYNTKIELFKNQNNHNSPIDYSLNFDLEYRIPNDLLLRTDRATMASGVEAREPFLDHKLVEFAMSIPYTYKTGNNFDKTKLILKELALKYFDHEFVYRPKQGFPIPVGNWFLDKKVSSEFNEFICDKKIECLNYSYLKKIYQLHKIKKDNYGDRLFNIYLLEKYIRFWNIS
jgi:asparagine synthase (glutamine-hydrolysing)